MIRPEIYPSPRNPHAFNRCAHARGRPSTILLFSSFAEIGNGGQESLRQLVSRLDPARFRAVVVVPREGSLSRSLREIRIGVEILPLPKISLADSGEVLQALARLRRLVARERIAILHSDGPRNTFYAAVAGMLQRKPVVWHVRTSRKDPYDALLYGMCTRLILVADALKFRFRFRGSTRKCVTIHNGVDLLRFRLSCVVDGDGAEFGIERNDLVIATAGRLEARKGLLTLIEACAGLKGRHPKFKLLVAGRVEETQYARTCRQRAAEFGVLDRIRFLGHVPDMHRLLPQADIFVLPSIADEAFSRSILEAMAAGLPVVATDVGGAREAVVVDETGFLVPAGSSCALSTKLRRLAGDPELRRRMGRAGRARAVRCFDIEDNVARTGRLYQALQTKVSAGWRCALPERRSAARRGPVPCVPERARREAEHV